MQGLRAGVAPWAPLRISSSSVSEAKESHSGNPLTSEDYDLIFESLRYTKEKFRNYDRYPDEAFRRSRVEAVEVAIKHLRELRQR